jgi:hypothetical protein
MRWRSREQWVGVVDVDLSREVQVESNAMLWERSGPCRARLDWDSLALIRSSKHQLTPARANSSHGLRSRDVS